MPFGMWRSQNSIGSPNTRVSTPAARRCAAAARPYGPAPTMATWQLVSFLPMDPPGGDGQLGPLSKHRVCQRRGTAPAASTPLEAARYLAEGRLGTVRGGVCGAPEWVAVVSC